MLAGIIAVLTLLAFETPPVVVLDRIAVVVGKRPIKTSDIDRDLRITAFLNKEPLILNTDTWKKAADRLIDQLVIRQVIAGGEYPRATDAEAADLLNQIRSSRFAGSDVRLAAELNRYGLSKTQLQEQLLWQLTVLRFIDERFRPGIQVADDDVRKYYDQHLAEFKRQYPQDSSFASLEPRIRDLLEGEEINKQFEAWLGDSRSRTFIEFHDEAMSPASKPPELKTTELKK
jgi:parvulin-like peptidyl-prolyl isomerase